MAQDQRAEVVSILKSRGISNAAAIYEAAAAKHTRAPKPGRVSEGLMYHVMAEAKRVGSAK